MKKLIVLTVVGALSLVIAGCSTTTSAPSAPSVADTQGECEGIRVVVDFTKLDDLTIDKCVAATEPMTALAALTAVGLDITGSKEAGDNWICRVDGRPSATEELRTETQGPFIEDCAAYGSGWAFWALYLETGADWAPTNEGVATQKVKPGESVGVVWQLTDDAANMDAWQKPSV
jgi:hypothetical protein